MDNQVAKQFSKKQSSSKINASNRMGELRIIAGKWRSRKLTFPTVQGLRPSPSRVRETLFSWLTHQIHDSRCLDLFSGSGALGFEALSRGAKTVTMVEQNKQVVQQLQLNKNLLQAEDLLILNQDACNLSAIKGNFDIVFCDPPFNKDLVQPLLDELHQSGLLNSSARLYIETEKNLSALQLAEDWTLLKEKVTGDVRYRLIEVGKY